MTTAFFRTSLALTCLALLSGCGGRRTEPPTATGTIAFMADRTALRAGECTLLRWEASAGFVVRLSGEEVPKAAEREVCPTESRSYELWVDMGTHVETRVIEITVSGVVALGTEPTPSATSRPIPTSQPGAWVRLGGPPGGLGYDIRYNFADPNIWYVTDTGGGVHISTDNGLTWQASNSGIPPQRSSTNDAPPIFSLTVDPHDPQIIWVGTLDNGHIYRSTDGGQTWQERDSGITVEYDLLSFRGFTVDPRSSDIVYAMGETTLETIDDPSGLRQQVGGVIYKTTDGGESWELLWYGGVNSSLTRYMWIDPRDPDVLYVSTGIFDRFAVGGRLPQIFSWEGGLGVIKSTDGGKTWRTLGQEHGLRMLYIGSLFMHPDDSEILLAAAGHLIDGTLLKEWEASGAPISAGIYRTTDGGEHWTQTLIPSQWEAFTAVELCPSDPNIGYAGSEKAFYFTQDAGQTWQLASGADRNWGPAGVEAGWPIDLQCDPRNPARVFANNYNGGNFLTEDYGRSWVNASDGYSGAILFRVEVDPVNPARVYAAGRNGVWRSDDGGYSWTGIYNPPPDRDLRGIEWTFVATDPSQSDHILGGHAPLLESNDGGNSWQLRWENEGNAVVGTVSVAVFAPPDTQVVYAGLAGDGCIRFHESIPCDVGGGVLVSHDGGKIWQSASGGDLGQAAVYDLAVDHRDSRLAYAAADTGLFQTADGGTTWTQLRGLPESVRIRSVAVDPSDEKHLLAAVDRRGTFTSHDGGQTWQETTSGLEPNGSIHDIVFDQVNPGVVYVSDVFSGVYWSEDGGATWEKMNTGLSNRAALGLSLSSDGQHLYVATHGGGAFRLDLNGQSPQPAR